MAFCVKQGFVGWFLIHNQWREREREKQVPYFKGMEPASLKCVIFDRELPKKCDTLCTFGSLDN